MTIFCERKSQIVKKPIAFQFRFGNFKPLNAEPLTRIMPGIPVAGFTDIVQNIQRFHKDQDYSAWGACSKAMKTRVSRLRAP